MTALRVISPGFHSTVQDLGRYAHLRTAIPPAADRWTFRTVSVERALARGFSILGNLNSPPEWAALNTGTQPYEWWHARLPRDWAEYATYVRRTVEAFPGIRVWEVGNEMDCDFLIVPPDRDKPAVYADLVKRTRAATLHAVSSPRSQPRSPATSASAGWLSAWAWAR